MIRYMRAHGLGNDYIVLDLKDSNLKYNSQIIQAICDRHCGIGGDGLLIEETADTADFAVKIFNPDGSSAEKSGNGLRIFAKYLYEQGRFKDSCSIKTDSGIVYAKIEKQNSEYLISINMGKAEFIAIDGNNVKKIDQYSYNINIESKDVQGIPISMGNPHFVIFYPFHTKNIEIDTLGPKIECHKAFKNRTNVQFAFIESEDTVFTRIWERGAKETLASGSSACAVAIAGHKLGILGNKIKVNMLGGRLLIEILEDGNIKLSGPVVSISYGAISSDLEKCLELLQ